MVTTNNRTRVLIVHPDFASLQSLHARLASEGFEVLTARTGPEAVARMKAQGEQAPRIVLSADDMPGMGGTDLCQELQGLSLHDPVHFILLVTSDRKRMQEGYEAGVTDFLFEPYNANELLARMLTADRVCALHSQVRDKTQVATRLHRRLAGTGAGAGAGVN